MIKRYNNGLGAFFYYDLAYDQYAFFVEERYGQDGGLFVPKLAEPLVMVDRPKPFPLPEPTARFDRKAVQLMFDMLWEEGFRPKDGTGDGGHMAAMSYHLEDMRKLVFKDKSKPTKG